MSKAFTKETDRDDEDERDEIDILPAGQKNYMTPHGFAVLQDELRQLLNVERPKIVEIVSWAAGNGDRSENGDYIYGKKKLREIDRRVYYLTKRLEHAEIVNPAQQQKLKQVFFGATVTFAREDNSEQTIKIVGIDEADLDQKKVSFLSPIARALLKAGIGDVVELRTPGGVETLEVLTILYI